MIIEWEQEVPFVPEVPFGLVASCCETAEGVDLPLAVHVLITTDEHIREVNASCRGIDRATDVLSFPTVNYPKGKTAGTSPKHLRLEMDPEIGACVLGDILISLEHARAQAEEYGHSLTRELCYLFCHGLFHLMGYDHMEEEEKKVMRAMEEKALTAAGICREEAPMTDDVTLMTLAREAMKNSYSPYSHFAVGAALLAKDGRVFLGCNIENASFGITICAERTALFKAVSEGEKEFAAIAIASDGSTPWPCGACRQALNEFAPSLRVLVCGADGISHESTLMELLPYGFGPKDL